MFSTKVPEFEFFDEAKIIGALEELTEAEFQHGKLQPHIVVKSLNRIGRIIKSKGDYNLMVPNEKSSGHIQVTNDYAGILTLETGVITHSKTHRSPFERVHLKIVKGFSLGEERVFNSPFKVEAEAVYQDEKFLKVRSHVVAGPPAMYETLKEFFSDCLSEYAQGIPRN